MKRAIRTYSGYSTPAVTERELKHREISRAIAAEGMVLLKNEDEILPIKENQTVALYGNGIAHMIKGGTGSGDVNEREVVDLTTGLINSGVNIINKDAALFAMNEYNRVRREWADMISEKVAQVESGSDMAWFQVLVDNPLVEPAGVPIVPEEVEKADVVIYLLSRIAGEGRDRFAKEGDYYLTEAEKAELALISEHSDKIVVLINTGSQIELSDFLYNSSVKGIMFVSQGGMEMGNAMADLITGKVTPSGKLTDTWAYNYSDFPNSATFSHNNDDVYNEDYEEGIYVGYRYFDSFDISVAYPFGYGLSYTTFQTSTNAVLVTDQEITVEVTVTNTGDTYSGKEVVQVYASCPQEKIKKEYKRLIGFKKTALLAPGESQTLTITMPAKNLASFLEDSGIEGMGQWIVEEGMYGIMVGNSLEDTMLAALLQAKQDYVLETVPHICPLQKEIKEIERPDEPVTLHRQAMFAVAIQKNIPILPFAPAKEIVKKQPVNPIDDIAKEIAYKLTDEELTAILIGEITKGQDNLVENKLVTTGIFVPGAAGDTTATLEEKYNVPSISLADGPAGLRLMRNYDVDRATGAIYGSSLFSSLEGGLFAPNYDRPDADRYYMYATAIPVGTLLASTWDIELNEKIGAMVGEEMVEFHVAWWLAPGMNIHRNPLCGRNFEYYSEDPLLSGMMAAAITSGVQSVPGVGTTIKHFAFNNQEDNRVGSSSNLSERAIREIYLRGFEIAIKSSQPMCIMTSYNLVNGVHTANSYDINTQAARNEWGFEGIIMTDWTTTAVTNDIPSIPHMCARSGNDLIMPGCQHDVDEYLEALASGELPRPYAQECARRMIRVILQTLGMEDAKPYRDQFDLAPYVK